MRNIRINTELPDEVFDIRARARELSLGEQQHGADSQRSFMRRK